MNQLNKIIASIAFLFSLVIYIMTMAPTTSFWDCGEFIATSVIMGVPHPPGTPLYLLLGNFFSQIPIFNDIGARVNLISPIASAFAVMFLYLIIVQLIEEWRGETKIFSDYLITYGSALIGSLTFAFTDSHWFNAVEAEVYSLSTFFTSIVVWLILKWNKNSGFKGNVRYILIIAYMFGLAIGIHLLNLLALPFIALIIYFNKYEFEFKTFIFTIIATLITFVTIYLGIIKGIPNLLATNNGLTLLLILLLIIIGFLVTSVKNNYFKYSTILMCLVLILVGFSTYSTIFIRATQHPSINENNPDTFEGALSYMNREQYGSWEILDPAFTLARSECAYSDRWTENKQNPTKFEEINFLWNYQIKEMYLRYFAWQFIGKEDYDSRSWDLVTLKGDLIKKLRGIDWSRYGLPFPFLFGLIGMIFHFSRDWKRALAVLALFLATGLMIILYLNQYDPQPRERDYSYVGSFFAFSIWIGIGVAALQEKIKDWLEGVEIAAFVSIGLTGILLILMPLSILATDYDQHNRKGNYVAWDYAYNMLNSCEPNGIIFTNGDNDTFPLWYIQEVEGVRKDVRVVNLSLLNTPWYIEQLKNQAPKLPIQFSDNDINNLEPYMGTIYALGQWTGFTKQINQQIGQLFAEQEIKQKKNEISKLNQDEQTEIINAISKKYSERNDNYRPYEHGLQWPWKNEDAIIIIDDSHSFKFQISPTISNFLRLQDIMILQIIQDAIKNHPIYFAVTVAPRNRLGLDDYLSMEGLVYRLTYEKSTDSSPSPRLNYNRMLQNITESSDYKKIIKNPEDYNLNISSGHGIYRYTNLNNPDIFFNENIRRLIQNYRTSFLQLTLQNLYSPDGLQSYTSKVGHCKGYEKIYATKAECTAVGYSWIEDEIITNDAVKILEMMDKYFPPNIIPTIDPDLEIQVGRIYHQAGRSKELIKRLEYVSQRTDVSMETKMFIGQIYLEELKSYDSAINYYTNLYDQHPINYQIVLALTKSYIMSNRKSDLDYWLDNNPHLNSRDLQLFIANIYIDNLDDEKAAIKHLENLNAMYLNDKSVIYSLSKLYIKNNQFIKAQKLLKNIIDSKIYDSEAVELQLYIVNKYVENKQYDEAINLCEYLNIHIPNNSEIFYTRLNLLINLGYKDQSIKLINDWLTLNPDDSRAKEILSNFTLP